MFVISLQSRETRQIASNVAQFCCKGPEMEKYRILITCVVGQCLLLEIFQGKWQRFLILPIPGASLTVFLGLPDSNLMYSILRNQ